MGRTHDNAAVGREGEGNAIWVHVPETHDDAQHLLQFTPNLDISRVREHLARITERGYAREQDREAKLAVVLHDVGYLKR